MGKIKSHRSSLKMGQVIRKKAKAKRDRERKVNKFKQFPKHSKKKLVAPKSLPNREEIEAEVHASTDYINKFIRPVASQVAASRKKEAKKGLDQLHSQIMAQYHERVNGAKLAYATLQDAIEGADAFVEVLDARDPSACRFLNGEGEIINKKKPLIIVINKVDLVPREVAAAWITSLNKTAPTIAMSAITEESASAILSQAVSVVCPGSNAIAVFGIQGVGKSTICKASTILKELPALTFAESSDSLCLLNAAVWQEPMVSFAAMILSRAIHSKDQTDLFSIFGVDTSITDPDEIIECFAALWKMPPKNAARRLVELFVDGKQPFYSVPESFVYSEEIAEQTAALALSVPFDLSTTQYVQFSAGAPITVNETLLNETFEEEDDDEEEEQ